MSAAAVRMYFPSPRGFAGTGETGNVTGGGRRGDDDAIAAFDDELDSFAIFRVV